MNVAPAPTPSASCPAEALATSQAEISKVEHRTDVYVSTLRRYIEALGGRLEITAHFPDGDVRITQFQALEDGPHRPTVPNGRAPVRRVG